MLMNELSITQSDGYKTVLYPYYADTDTPKGSILILHGMQEHHERYTEFAEFLNTNEYDVFLYNHRGHGKDKKLEELGFFDEKKGSEKVVRDAVHILDFIRKNGRSDNLILFGHSMGSFIARNVVQIDDDISKLIICGTAQTPALVSHCGFMLGSLLVYLKGPKKLSPFMNNMMFGSKLYSSVCTRTSFDWLTRHNATVGQYINDPYCGFICTTSMYRDIMKLIINATSASCTKLTRHDLPILIISGENDPVGGCGKEVAKYFAMLQRLGFTKVECTLYEDCRHELLNELNKRDIMSDIVTWLNVPVVSDTLRDSDTKNDKDNEDSNNID